MLFNNGFDMEPASGAKPANAVVYQGWKHFFMLKCILKGVWGGAEFKCFVCIYRLHSFVPYFYRKQFKWL